jgi:hypothetical protein
MRNKIILFSSMFIFSTFFAQVGIRNTNPVVNLDARAATGNSAIAFGNTSLPLPVQ